MVGNDKDQEMNSKKKSAAAGGNKARTATDSVRVDKEAVATKHPGVFVVTEEMERELCKKLPVHKKEEKPATVEQSPEVKEEPPEQGEDAKPETEEGSRRKRKQASKKGSNNRRQQAQDIKDRDDKQEAGEVEVSAGPDDQDGEDDGKRARVTRSSRRSARKQEAKKINEEEAPAATVMTEGEDNNTTEEDDTEDSEAELAASARDNESVASGVSTLTTRSSNKERTARASDGQTKKGNGKAGRSKSRIAATVATGNKGKGRRHIFKKSASKAPSAVARSVTSNRVFYNGQFYTRGDIVSVTDVDGGVYYAQLRGFLTDQYCDKSGVITWLLPTAAAPPPEQGFDASRYVVGPEEELPRRLEYFTFVMHAPDDYFHHRTAPYPVRSQGADQEYVMTRAGPKVRLVKGGGRAVYQDLK